MAPEGEFENSPDGTIRFLVAYSRCVGYERPQVADSILGLPLLSAEQITAAERKGAGSDKCLGGLPGGLEVSVPPVFLTGLAEGRYLRLERNKDPVRIVAAGQAAVPQNGWEAFSLCLVRRNPTAARAILDTSARSEGEERAVRALVPEIAPCVPAGQQLKFDRMSVRLYVAWGLYRSALGGNSG
jgi:hypothetical protein